jgi:hypothetical protein
MWRGIFDHNTPTEAEISYTPLPWMQAKKRAVMICAIKTVPWRTYGATDLRHHTELLLVKKVWRNSCAIAFSPMAQLWRNGAPTGKSRGKRVSIVKSTTQTNLHHRKVHTDDSIRRAH